MQKEGKSRKKSKKRTSSITQETGSIGGVSSNTITAMMVVISQQRH